MDKKTTEKPDVIGVARDQRHILLLRKIKEGKGLTQREIAELAKLEKQKNKNKPTDKVKCEYCGREFSKRGIASHKRVHTQDNPKGRPSKFYEDMIRQAQLLAIKGFTDKEIAEMFGVSEPTINSWKVQYPDFLKSLKNGKKIADEMVVRALFERATGYSHPDVHISNYQGDVTVTSIIKHYPPDPISCIFWLKNRDPENWRDKQDVEHSGKIEGSGVLVVPGQLTEEEWEKRQKNKK